MSGQDYETCAICGELRGYDDRKGIWWGDDRRGREHSIICGEDKKNLLRRFAAFFGLNSYSSDETGIIVEWHEMRKILSSIQRDQLNRTRFVVAEKELYERTKTTPCHISEE